VETTWLCNHDTAGTNAARGVRPVTAVTDGGHVEAKEM